MVMPLLLMHRLVQLSQLLLMVRMPLEKLKLNLLELQLDLELLVLELKGIPGEEKQGLVRMPPLPLALLTFILMLALGRVALYLEDLKPFMSLGGVKSISVALYLYVRGMCAWIFD